MSTGTIQRMSYFPEGGREDEARWEGVAVKCTVLPNFLKCSLKLSREQAFSPYTRMLCLRLVRNMMLRGA